MYWSSGQSRAALAAWLAATTRKDAGSSSSSRRSTRRPRSMFSTMSAYWLTPLLDPLAVGDLDGGALGADRPADGVEVTVIEVVQVHHPAVRRAHPVLQLMIVALPRCSRQSTLGHRAIVGVDVVEPEPVLEPRTARVAEHRRRPWSSHTCSSGRRVALPDDGVESLHERAELGPKAPLAVGHRARRHHDHSGGDGEARDARMARARSRTSERPTSPATAKTLAERGHACGRGRLAANTMTDIITSSAGTKVMLATGGRQRHTRDVGERQVPGRTAGAAVEPVEQVVVRQADHEEADADQHVVGANLRQGHRGQGRERRCQR